MAFIQIHTNIYIYICVCVCVCVCVVYSRKPWNILDIYNLNMTYSVERCFPSTCHKLLLCSVRTILIACHTSVSWCWTNINRRRVYICVCMFSSAANIDRNLSWCFWKTLYRKTKLAPSSMWTLQSKCPLLGFECGFWSTTDIGFSNNKITKIKGKKIKDLECNNCNLMKVPVKLK